MDKKLALIISGEFLELKADNITTYETKGLDYADYIIFLTGNSNTHLQGMAKKISNFIKKDYKLSPIVANRNISDNDWIILDYGSIIIHLFLKEKREYYRIEALLGSSKIIYDESSLKNLILLLNFNLF